MALTKLGYSWITLEFNIVPDGKLQLSVKLLMINRRIKLTGISDLEETIQEAQLYHLVCSTVQLHLAVILCI